MTCVCVCVLYSGGLLGSNGGLGGRCVSDGAGVRLPAPQVWRGGLGPRGAARRPLPPLCHTAVRPHCHRDHRGFTAHATAHP